MIPSRRVIDANTIPQVAPLSDSPEETHLADTAGRLVSQKPVLSEAKRKLLEKYQFGRSCSVQAPAHAIVPRSPGEQMPLLPVQEGVWRRALATNGVPSFYNEAITIHRIGDLSRAVLERAFTEIIRRHEVWRTSFETVGGEAIQLIHPPSSVQIPFVDLRGIPEESREPEAQRLATDDARQPFDLRQGPLLRALLVRMDEQRHRLCLTMHQSITDGLSVYQIFPSELSALYAAYSVGDPSPLPSLPIQYADFAYSERQLFDENVFDKQVAYWRQHLSGGLVPLRWPCEQSQTAARSLRGSIHPFIVPKHIRDGLRALSRQGGVTFFTTLLAGFAALLFRYTEQEEIVTGTVAPAARKRTEVQKLLGYFLNPVVLRIDLSGNPSIRDLLRKCHEITFEALSNDDVPLEYLTDQLKLGTRPNCDCPFNTVITLAPPASQLDTGWSQTPMDVDSGWARWDLYLELSDRPTGILGRAQYRTDIFTPVTITRFVRHFAMLLEGFLVNSEQRVSDLPSFCVHD